ncbi:hypothetical protein LTS10_005898 [Elasticomyces elasticus]|nr:hypothetical protein LTS10_005898 [Elasticomyces elasticus]
MTATMSSTPPFFRLPQELRDDIYRLVVVKSHGTVGFSMERNIWAKPPEAHQYLEASKQPALSQTCRALRDEVLPIYYSENKVYVTLEADVYDPILLERSGDWCLAHPSFLALSRYRLRDLLMFVPMSMPPGLHPICYPGSATLRLTSKGRGGPLKLEVEGLLPFRCCCRIHDYARDLNGRASGVRHAGNDQRIYDFVRWMAESMVPLLIQQHEPGNECSSCGKSRCLEEKDPVELTEDSVYINGPSPATGDDDMSLEIGSWYSNPLHSWPL